MKSNKDGGTGVGFSKKWNDDVKDIGEKLKTKECEHEWVMEIPSGIVYCKNCLLHNTKYDFKPIDFKIPENLSQINKQQWEDIWRDYTKYGEAYAVDADAFFSWLKESYEPPKKKVI